MEDRAALLARVSASAGTEIKDPATGEVIGSVSFGTPGDVAGAVTVAAAAQPARPRWRAGPSSPRYETGTPDVAAHGAPPRDPG